MMISMNAEIHTVTQPERAAALIQHPLRQKILVEARTPASATELARRLNQPRQRLNYHVKQLEKHGFLRLESRRKKRNMEERRYVATARAFVLAPQLLGALGATPESATDAFSATYLLGLAVQAQRELTDVAEAAAEANVRVLTLSLSSELRFSSGPQRAAFGQALTAAVAEVIAQHTSPSTGRPYRLLLGCYPIPAVKEEKP
jgi:DNA-binding transcriptional ArsR family regulator